MAEYYISFPTTDTTDLDEWPYYSQGSRAYWSIVVPRLRIILSRYATQYMQAYAPVRAVADGSLVTWDIPITGEDYNADIYQYYPYTGARVDFFIQLGNSRFGLAVWVYEHYGESDETRICKLVGTVTDYHFQRTLVNMTGAMKITYDSVTGLASAYVDGSLVHSATYGTGIDCLFGITGRGKLDYGMMCYMSSMTITAGTLSESLYAGGMAGSLEPLEFKSPFDGYIGNRARYDIVYAPQLSDLVPMPTSWDSRYTNTDYRFGDGAISTQKVYDITRYFRVWGHLSGYFYLYIDEYTMYGLYPWTLHVEGINRDTGAIEEFLFECTYVNPTYMIRIVAPDGTTYDRTSTGRIINEQWTAVSWVVDEEEGTITWVVTNRSSTGYSISAPFPYDYYKFTKLVRNPPTYSYGTFGACGWWFRGLPGAIDPTMDSVMQCFAGGNAAMECTGTQWMEKVFNVFRDAIYNPLLLDDPATLKGMKLTNVDGQGSIMALDSVCIVIDMYKRVYVYSLKEDIGVAESIPDIVHAYRSATGHYWELIDMKTAGDESRLYSEQCAVEVALGTPGVCEYDSAADTSKTMVQLVHEGVVNPLYLRAFKVPGQHQISIVTSEEISAYKVIVNILLAT